MKKFALIGAAGYIAPRHMQAIKDTQNTLVAAFDPFDSVGVLDRYFDDVDFFTEFERFDRHLDLLRRKKEKAIDYISICSPNYLHDSHIRFALRMGANPICEKPLALNPWNIDALSEVEKEVGKKIYNILQLRTHPSIISVREKIQKDSRRKNEKYNIDLSYITTRGKWYFYSWKGQLEKSGGVAANIGIHFFDMLMWIFGKAQHSEVHYSNQRKIGGFIELENANVRWFLSLDKKDLPKKAKAEAKPTFRSITIDGEELEFSGGFTDLHTVVYDDILKGEGCGLEEARASIDLVYRIRHAEVFSKDKEKIHPALMDIITNDPT
jgi:UDP-N-acetyl-2-amino-2-deoxyglucuronate dehydrogenase